MKKKHSDELGYNYRHGLVPGGAHTYSRGDDTFPESAPSVLVKGKGAHVWDETGRRYIDWAMSLRSVIVGHANRHIDSGVTKALRNGVNLARPVPEEFQLAERLVELIPAAEMVKFGKNGSDATAGAVRLARAATGRDIILRSTIDPFLGVGDWFIGSTVMDRGVPIPVRQLTKSFRHNDLSSLEDAFRSHPGQVAAIVMEPAPSIPPLPGFLQGVRELANTYGALLIFDETVSGFRFSLSGAQHYFGVRPDLSTFGKGIANGYALSALVGKRQFMELGGLAHPGKRVFLMSSTYGPERVGLVAGTRTLQVLERLNGPSRLWEVGRRLKQYISDSVSRHQLEKFVAVSGFDCSPVTSFTTSDGAPDDELKTLFMEKMLEQNILLSSNLFSPALAHSEIILKKTGIAIEKSFASVAQAIRSDAVADTLQGRKVMPVFRSHN